MRKPLDSCTSPSGESSSTRSGSVDAQLFNQISLLLKRTEEPLALRLRAVNGYDCQFTETGWLCTSYLHGDRPVMRWHNFRRRRSSLTGPVACDVDVYHDTPDLVVRRILESMAREVDILMQRLRSEKVTIVK